MLGIALAFVAGIAVSGIYYELKYGGTKLVFRQLEAEIRRDMLESAREQHRAALLKHIADRTPQRERG